MCLSKQNAPLLSILTLRLTFYALHVPFFKSKLHAPGRQSTLTGIHLVFNQSISIYHIFHGLRQNCWNQEPENTAADSCRFHAQGNDACVTFLLRPQQETQCR